MRIQLRNPSNALFSLSCFLISIIVMPLCLFVFTFSFIFKHLLNTCLKIAYRNKYMGILSGFDALWVMGEHDKMAIDIIFIIKVHTSPENAIHAIKEGIVGKISNCSEKFARFSCTVHKSCGYGYLLKNYSSQKDITSVINIDNGSTIYSKTYLEIFSDIANEPFPADNTAMVKVILLEASSEWRRKNNLLENQHPMLIRLHHAIGDGVTLLTNIADIIPDEKIDFDQIIKKATQSKTSEPLNFMERLFWTSRTILLMPGYFILMKFFNEVRGDVVFRAPLACGRRDIYSCVQTESLEKVKRIKNKIGNTSFMEVMSTAISASLREYFEKSNVPVPDEIMISFPIMIMLPKVTKSTDFTGSLTMFRHPLPIRTSATSLLKRLEEIKRRRRPTVHGPDAQARHVLWSYVVGTLPTKLALTADSIDSVNLGFSNLPGIPKMIGYNKKIEIDNMFYVPPSFCRIGVSGSFFSYNDQLHIGIATDSDIMVSEENRRDIVYNIFKYIELLDEEVTKAYSK